MILPFQPQFKDSILQGVKIHTIREDQYNRWKPGMLIHFCTSVRTKNYDCFKIGEVKSIQQIEFVWWPHINGTACTIWIDNKKMCSIDILSKCDGFINPYQFLNWPSWKLKNFKGRLIHWTEFRY